MIKVLHVLSSLDGGGVERMLYNYYTHMTRSKVHFDFVVHDSKIGMLEEEFLKMGSNIVHVTRKKDSILKNFYEIKKYNLPPVAGVRKVRYYNERFESKVPSYGTGTVCC